MQGLSGNLRVFVQGFKEENGQRVAYNTMIYSESEVTNAGKFVPLLIL